MPDTPRLPRQFLMVERDPRFAAQLAAQLGVEWPQAEVEQLGDWQCLAKGGCRSGDVLLLSLRAGELAEVCAWLRDCHHSFAVTVLIVDGVLDGAALAALQQAGVAGWLDRAAVSAESLYSTVINAILSPARQVREAQRRRCLLGPSLPGIAIDCRLEQTGATAVYRGRCVADGQALAIKTLWRDQVQDARERQRFAREIRLLQAIEHRHVVRLVGAGEQGEALFMLTEYFPGSLRQRLQAGPLAAPEAVRYLTELTAGLVAIHQQGVLHGDLKPDHAMLREDGSAAWIDFDTARPFPVSGAASGGTEVFGTSGYMSPEHHSPERLDARSDLYSLGVMFYEMLLGETPARYGAADSYPPVAPRLPAPYQRYQPLLDKMLAGDPRRRYPSSLAMLSALCPANTSP